MPAPGVHGDVRRCRRLVARRRCRAPRPSRGRARPPGRRCSGKGCVAISSREAGRVERLARERVELVAGERDPRRRAQQVRLAVAAARLERVRPRDLVLANAGSQASAGDVEAVARDDPALVHRVLGRVAQRDEPRLALERRRRRGVATSSTVAEGDRRAPSSSRSRSAASSARRGAREKPPTRTLTGWIARPPSTLRIRLPDLLEREAALDELAGGRFASSRALG